MLALLLLGVIVAVGRLALFRFVGRCLWLLSLLMSLLLFTNIAVNCCCSLHAVRCLTIDVLV